MQSSRVELISRILGAVLGAGILGIVGVQVAEMLAVPPLRYILILGAVGAVVGLIITPYITVRPINRIRHVLSAMPLDRLLALIIGVFLGLLAAALFSIPLSQLPPPFKQIMPIASALVLCYLGGVLMMARYKDLLGFFSGLRPSLQRGGRELEVREAKPELVEKVEPVILLDTSVIIDGRIFDICRTGFVRGALLVPAFILKELQYIADSSDSLRRNRGRRGLEILGLLQNESPVPIRFIDQDVSSARDADSKLVALARKLDCPIMTNDYNLNRVAELQGIPVMNINDLANAVKASFLPGEELSVTIIQEGKEYGQGVGYLDDGTMVVVEDGYKLMNRTENVTVTKVLQTAAGRMIFAKR